LHLIPRLKRPLLIC